MGGFSKDDGDVLFFFLLVMESGCSGTDEL